MDNNYNEKKLLYKCEIFYLFRGKWKQNKIPIFISYKKTWQVLILC